MRKNVFYIHTNILSQKRGQRNVPNNFFRYTRIVRKKNVGKKSSEKGRKNVFYIHTNIVTKKCGQKMHETIFPETHE